MVSVSGSFGTPSTLPVDLQLGGSLRPLVTLCGWHEWWGAGEGAVAVSGVRARLAADRGCHTGRALADWGLSRGLGAAVGLLLFRSDAVGVWGLRISTPSPSPVIQTLSLHDSLPISV